MTVPTSNPVAAEVPAREGRWAKVIVLVLLALAGVFFGLTWWTDAQSLKAAALSVDEKDLDFGEGWESGDFSWEIPVKNGGKRTVVISGFDTNCDCMKVEPPTLVLDPGEVRRCRATLRVTGPPGVAPSLAARPFQTLITPIIAGSTGLGQPAWKVHGVVKPVALMKPTSLYFDELTATDAVPRREVVCVTTAEPVAEWSFRCDPKKVTASATRSRTDPCVFDLVVIPQLDALPSGPFATTIRLVARTGEGKELPPVELGVEGVVIEDVQAVPASVPFGVQPLGGTGTETVVLRSRKGLPFRVEKVEEGPDVTVRPEQIDGSPEKRFRLSRRMTQKGFHAGVAHFHVRSEGQPPVKIPVPWSYYGVEK